MGIVIFKNWFTYWKGRVREKEGENEIFYELVHLSNSHKMKVLITQVSAIKIIIFIYIHFILKVLFELDLNGKNPKIEENLVIPVLSFGCILKNLIVFRRQEFGSKNNYFTVSKVNTR